MTPDSNAGASPSCSIACAVIPESKHLPGVFVSKLRAWSCFRAPAGPGSAAAVTGRVCAEEQPAAGDLISQARGAEFSFGWPLFIHLKREQGRKGIMASSGARVEGEVGARVGDFLVENDASLGVCSFVSCTGPLGAPSQRLSRSSSLVITQLSLFCLLSFPVTLPFSWPKVASRGPLASMACGKVSLSY